MVEEISSELELRPLLTRIVTHACELLGADDGSIGLYDPGAESDSHRSDLPHACARAGCGSRGRASGLPVPCSPRGGPVVLTRYGDLPNPRLPELAENSVIGVPIRSRGAARRLLRHRRTPAAPLRRRDLSTLQLFARHAAIAIDNAMRYQREKRAQRAHGADRARVAARVARDWSRWSWSPPPRR